MGGKPANLFPPEIIYQLVCKGALFLERWQVRAEAAGLFAAIVFLENGSLNSSASQPKQVKWEQKEST